MTSIIAWILFKKHAFCHVEKREKKLTFYIDLITID